MDGAVADGVPDGVCSVFVGVKVGDDVALSDEVPDGEADGETDGEADGESVGDGWLEEPEGLRSDCDEDTETVIDIDMLTVGERGADTVADHIDDDTLRDAFIDPDSVAFRDGDAETCADRVCVRSSVTSLYTAKGTNPMPPDTPGSVVSVFWL